MKTILVPSDFSKNATTALKFAIRINQIMKSKLVVFHCVHETPYKLSNAKTEEEMDSFIKKDEKECVLKLKKQVDNAYSDLGFLKTSGNINLVAEFNPIFVEKTIEIAKKYKSQLIVMGTHGASGLKKLFFGSNTSVMIAKSDIPVLAVPEKYRFRDIKTFVYASDLENISSELSSIISFAKYFNARIDVLHFDYGIDLNKKHINYAENYIKKNRYKKINLVLQKANDQPLLKQVKKYLETHRQQCLVMFTRKRSFWDKLMVGSKTEDMSTALQTPLLSFKK